MPPITIDDLARAQASLITDCSKETADSWSLYIPQTPEELYAQLTQDFPYQSFVELGINEAGAGWLNFQIMDGAAEVAQARRSFDIPGRVAENQAFAVWREEHRGKGIAKALIWNTFSVYQGWGVEQVRVHTGLDQGGYVWAKYGFKVSKEEWVRIRPELLNNLWALYLPPEWSDVATRIINSDDPKDLWTLSELTYPVNGTTLARRLLEGTVWSGTLEFNDPESMKRLRERVR